MASNTTFVRQLYQIVLARDPDAASSNWITMLDSGFFTQPQVLYHFLSSSEYEQGAETIGRLYYAANGATLDLFNLQTWMSIYRQGATLDQIANQFITASATFSAQANPASTGQYVDLLYQNVLGRPADAAGRAAWVAILDQGMSRGAALAAFAGSPEFQNKADPVLANTMAYYAFAGRKPTSAELSVAPTDLTNIVVAAASKTPVTTQPVALAYSALALSESAANDGSITSSITITSSGDTYSGSIGSAIGKVTGTPSGLTAVLIKTTDTTATLSFTGTAKAHGVANSTDALTITFSGADFTSKSIAGKLGATQQIKVSFFDLPLVETNGVLALNGALSNNLVVDLASDKITFAGAEATLTSGSIANVRDINAKGLTGSKVTVTLIGDDSNNTLQTSALGATVTGAGGDDQLTGNAGADQFVFAATAAANGVDTLYNFKPGAGGDTLNFSAFLNKTGTSHLAPVRQDSTANTAWENGDVLVVTSNGLDTPAAIAALFQSRASNAPYAQPSAAAKSAPAKVVMITADIIGDAKIWYIVNQTNTSTVEASEITLVGTLKDINNLGLTGYGFAASNFA